ncbi:universal stress protein [Haloarcula litorea]|uniref:universal stress protein n=1 Tax=Haloarcula litorea TaxID=3032579 RepID=UPI0023E76600|nr:universal stress protein [Halomicroarcula sp. GDY20]
MYERLLLPYDGSNEGRRGVEHGIELAAALGATVHALYVAKLPDAPRALYYDEDEDELIERFRDHGEELTAEVAEMAEAAGVDCVTAVTFDSPAAGIVEYAEEEGMDAIVMGSAYTGALRALLGNTTDKVVRSATVPVITHRIRQHEPDGD